MTNKQIIPFTYINENISDNLGQAGMFIAVKIINLFVQTYASGNKITYSNNELIGKFNCKLSSLHDAFRVLENVGIVKRTFKDEKRKDRGEFYFDVELAMQWLRTTKFDESYKKAQKRSLFRAFVNQTVIVVKDVKSRILEAVGKRRTADRKERIEKNDKGLLKAYKIKDF